jgi:peptide/nickel transport system permease protein
MAEEQGAVVRATAPSAQAEVATSPRPWQRARMRLMPALPLAVLLGFIGAAIVAPVLTPYDPVRNRLIESLIPPFWVDGGSTEHLLGTDGFGRDVFTRLLYGARISFLVAAFSIVIAMTIGTAIGVIAGYAGGWVDSVLMRFTDIMLALPTILVALVVAVSIGPSFQNLIMVLGLLIWPRIARLIRGETLLLKKQDFVRYAGAIGGTNRGIVLRHVVPNVLPTLLVLTTLEVGHVILVEASLSFLGAGLPAPTASWGVMIADGRALVATGWWIALFPGLAITATVLAANAMGDWLRDYLDPKTRYTA